MATKRVAKKLPPKKHRATLGDIAIAAVTLNAMRDKVDLCRLALLGAVHEAHSLKIPMDDLLDYARPVTEGLAHLAEDLFQTTGAILDATKRLHEKGRRA